MRRKLSVFRLPVDFGNESACPVSIQRHHANGVPRFIVHNGKVHLQSRSPRIAYPLQRSCRGDLSGVALAKSEASERSRFNTSTLQRSKGFTLVEILVVLVLLSLIVFALMAVFSGIQRAFRASLTQTDTLEGGRAVMDMMANDLATMTPANGATNVYYTPVNFFINEQAFPSQHPPTPLFQPLMSSPSGAMRSNILEDIFILSKGNINGVPSWVGTGYSVRSNLDDGTLYSLYRFYMTMPASLGPYGPSTMFNDFTIYRNYTNPAVWSHLMDGVVNLTAQAYDTNGIVMTNGYTNPLISHVKFVRFTPDLYGVTDAVFYSNAVPASVQIELGTLEDRALQHAEALSGANQSNYLSNDIGQVHLFRQRVWIRNVDPTAYQ